MSEFTTPGAQDEEIPRPGATPTSVTTQPSQSHMTLAAPFLSLTLPVVAEGNTSVGPTFTIKGEIHSEEDLLIDGEVEGRLDPGQNRLVVGLNGKVRAPITAREVDVHDAVNGNVEAAEKIILRKTSKLVSDLKMASIEIEDGASLKGSIDITRLRAAAATAKPPN